ncbi:glycosyltransferase [Actinoplanes solisilvae]|uniref:glycosyltransferase n=1 Tax=Actinoplanes solisilvae TaxID=2486853 RepID=UPI000FD7DBE2|nr:glycosyltransferase [Actinoplanes solisilvae]
MYDVAILSDLRYPGGNSASIVAEVRAQAAAGLTTVLIHVPSPHLRHARPFQSRIVACLRDGLADLAHDDGAEIAAKVLLIRQPRIFTREPAVPPRVRAGHTIVVADEPPEDDVLIERYFGPDVVWAPTSGRVRENVLRAAPRAVLPDTDWHEIIDVAEWQVVRQTPGTVPVIGRHGRPDPVKWPRDPVELLQAYPDSADVRVRILGGGEIGVQRLGRQPASWEIVEFGAETPREFLGTLDFFVYFHDPAWTDAFGRTILEAMASGVPVIAGPHFRSVFAEAAIYTHPAGVRDLVLRWHKDRPAYEAQVARARHYVTEQFGSASHIARLASLGVLIRGVAPPQRTAVRCARPARRVLLVGDDIARFRALARHLPADLEPVVVAGSAGLADAHAAGLLTEHLPSAADLGISDDRWTGFVRDRLRHLIGLYSPRAVLVGGVPHDGITAAIVAGPGPRWLWLRPAMWRRGTGGEWAARGAHFAGILEPGEFAAPGDEGWTTTARAGVSTVDPITELPTKRPRRGSGGNTLLCRGVEASLPGFTVVEAGPDELGGVTLAVSRADYASFHELLGARVPTVFVPDPAGVDDELTRARFAAAAGVAVCATDDDEAAAALERLADPAAREALSRRCAELPFGNGAADAAAWLAGHCHRRTEVETNGVR